MPRNPTALFPPRSDVWLQQIEVGRLPLKLPGTCVIAGSGIIV
jgi:hypothetical protein